MDECESAIENSHPLDNIMRKINRRMPPYAAWNALKGGIFMSVSPQTSRTLYRHPFSKAYWRDAALEFRNVKMLVFAALMIALRVALKSVSIPVGLDLRIGVAFLVNAYGAMTFGPVVALLAAAISDTLGVILFPTGVYFFPFIFVEMAGSLIFALFFYRTKITMSRIILARFTIDFVVNICMTTPLMVAYYSLILGKYYAIVDIPRIIKNIIMFIPESLLLFVFLREVMPRTKKLGLLVSDSDELKLTKKNIVTMACLFVLSCACLGAYSLYNYNTTSLSASYTTQERYDANESMNAIVLENHEELGEETVVSIVESCYRKFGSTELTYSVAVYTVDLDELEENRLEAYAEDPDTEYGLDTLRAYSKSKAKADDAMISVGLAEIVVDKNSGEVLSYSDDF